MDEVILESANAGNVLVETSPIFFPFYEKEAVDYIKNASRNLKVVSEQLEIPTNTATISEDFKKVYLKDGNETVAIYLEDYISHEIDSYLARLT